MFKKHNILKIIDIVKIYILNRVLNDFSHYKNTELQKRIMDKNKTKLNFQYKQIFHLIEKGYF